jgi:hypothetical protein
MCIRDRAPGDAPNRDAVESPREPQWTTTPPTEPGWYWVMRNEALSICELVFDEGKMWVTSPEYPEVEIRRAVASHWMRIEAPEVPR